MLARLDDTIPGLAEPKPMRVLLIAEAANPEWTSVPLEGWSHARAIAALTDAHLVTQVRNEAAIRRAGLDDRSFTAIDSEAVARRLWAVATRLRGGENKGWTTITALSNLAYYSFERLVWRQLGERIRRREFDLVHRLTPLSPTTPSLLASRCRRAGVPFVLGPLNGGVPWPKEFTQARHREKEWLSYVRPMAALLPGQRSTRRDAAAIIAGSIDAYEQVQRAYRHKCVYIPENGIDPARFERQRDRAAARPLRLVFAGRLVPYKGADMLLEAAAPLVRSGAVTIDILGDGPEMPALRAMVEREGLAEGVSLPGWIEHERMQERLAAADVFAFPSIREFGGAVVLEAMATGLVPVVVAYGGPAELIDERCGYGVPIGPRARIVAEFRRILGELAEAPERVDRMSAWAVRRARTLFTWEAKARQVLEVYRWVLGRRPDRPDFGMPLPTPAAAAAPVGVEVPA
jgi:glycosyltransferase involved in cell wall biosynthesis